MNSSYSKSKIIKCEKVSFKGKKVIEIDSNKKVEEIIGIYEDIKLKEQLEEEYRIKEEELQKRLVETEEACEQMIKNAQLEASNLKEDAQNEVLSIEKKAYEEGYDQGVKNGYEDGYKEAYEDNIEKAKEEADKIIENATNMLQQANDEIANYMKSNKENILNLSISIAEKIMRDKFEDKTIMENLLEKAIEEFKLRENFIIKVNSYYKESLDLQINELKEANKISSDVFVLEDNLLQKGNAIIETSKGRMIVGIDSVLEKIKEELL